MRCFAQFGTFLQFKKIRKTPMEVLLLVMLQASTRKFTKSNTPLWVFYKFLNCTNGAKLRKASYMFKSF